MRPGIESRRPRRGTARLRRAPSRICRRTDWANELPTSLSALVQVKATLPSGLTHPAVTEGFDAVVVGGTLSSRRTAVAEVDLKNQEIVWGQDYIIARRECERVQHLADGPAVAIGPPRPGRSSARCIQRCRVAGLPTRTRVRKLSTNLRMTAKSGHCCFRVSTIAACESVSSRRGLPKNAAAACGFVRATAPAGPSGRDVAGTRKGGIVTLDLLFGAGRGGCAFAVLSGARSPAA